MPTQAERRARTRQSLLDAAASVFAERGYHGATLDAIAERAGLSKGSVYHNFSSKHELFATLLPERIAARLGDVRETATAGEAAAGFLAGAGDARWAPLFFEFVAQAARDDEVRALFTAWLLDTRAALARLIADRAGGEPDERLAILVSALANGMLIELLFDDAVPRELLGEGLERLATGGAGATAPRRGA